MTQISIEVNGKTQKADAEARMLLSDFLRDQLRLTGTHVGCDTSQCGACVVLVNGEAVKSCTMLAQQAEGQKITTIEGIGTKDKLHRVQEAFREEHALQCGFCTPGMVMMGVDILRRHPNPDEKTVRAELEGNLCRCTGYNMIVNAILSAAKKAE